MPGIALEALEEAEGNTAALARDKTAALAAGKMEHLQPSTRHRGVLEKIPKCSLVIDISEDRSLTNPAKMLNNDDRRRADVSEGTSKRASAISTTTASEKTSERRCPGVADDRATRHEHHARRCEYSETQHIHGLTFTAITGRIGWL
ncbi:MAG: hypothetical protein CMM26_10780 [Rhodospirillaceae bacterium]|nr:hypothetical protein [Rhodospirillaceae bacterium]